MSSTNTVTYEVPIRVTVDLDKDESFRGYTADERSNAIVNLAVYLTKFGQEEFIDNYIGGPTLSVAEGVTPVLVDEVAA